jgi:hypothetical protein
MKLSKFRILADQRDLPFITVKEVTEKVSTWTTMRHCYRNLVACVRKQGCRISLIDELSETYFKDLIKQLKFSSARYQITIQKGQIWP